MNNKKYERKKTKCRCDSYVWNQYGFVAASPPDGRLSLCSLHTPDT
jgi:hypothetical protein